MTETLRNWAGNLTFHAARVHRPDSVEQVREIVAAEPRITVQGTRHSFSDVADNSEAVVSVERLNQVVSLDAGARSVTVEAGIRYGDLATFLQAEGWALENLASLPHISVGGSCATGTHGSGVGNGSLSRAVSAVEIVRADGELVSLRRGQDADFEGAVVAMGALGSVVRLTLDIVPTFDLRQTVYQRLPFAALADSFDAVVSSAYSVSLFTTWSSDFIDQVWVKRRDGEPAPDFPGATAATVKLHPLPESSPVNCTEQLDVPGPWFERLPHFKLDFTPSSGEELQAEYLLPRSQAFAALSEINAMREKIAPLLWVSEIRTIAADGLWMCPSYGQDSVAIHFTWRPMGPEVMAILPEIEARLQPFGARPHWGKLFDMKAERIQPLYPRYGDFVELANRFDPEGKFRNGFLKSRVFGP